MRVLHAPANVANQGWAIAEGLRALGHEAEVWHYGENKFGYECDRNPPFPPESARDLYKLIDEAIERFDVLHFHFGRSLVPRTFKQMPGLWDLPLYRAANKPVFFTFHGSDVRLRSQHMAENHWSYFKFADVACDEEQIATRMDVIRTFANETFICSPVNAPYVPDASFHPRAIEVERWPYAGATNRDVPLVVHVPSRRATKGTAFVERAVEKARADGLRFEFRLIEGLPNDEVRKVLSEADILVDNLLLGDYEVTGVEAMALGKVVVARMDDVVAQRMGDDVPVQNANPDTITSVLEGLLADADRRAEIGRASRAFVERHHDARVVAKQLIEHYENPPETFANTYQGWPALGDARRIERLDKHIVQLTAGLRAQGKTVTLVPMGRGFTRIGARIDALLRKVLKKLKLR